MTHLALLLPSLLFLQVPERRLPLAEYRDKMRGGWIGQMAGVAWGAPTEFKYADRIIPADEMPAWTPELMDQAWPNDDLYVQMTFLRSLELYGLDCPIRQAGIDFANSGYPLWCANDAGRRNLRSGIAPPDSGHPAFNKCPNDIDYRIEADFSGLIAPGLPQVPIDLGEVFGRLMNYGDGLYAGQFMGALYCEAFFETDQRKVVEAALRAIPERSQFAEMVRDLLAWSEETADWTKCWDRVQAKYRLDPEYQQASNGGIDTKINSAYMLLGMLYGHGDLEQTIIIATRAGLDSDCNPCNAAGVLGTSLGAAALPAKFVAAIRDEPRFSHTEYNLPAVYRVCEQLARDAVLRAGGRLEGEGEAAVFVIPQREPRPSALELSWAPGPIAGSRFSADEMAQITAPSPAAELQAAVNKVAPGWTISHCGADMNPGFRDEWRGRPTVLLTHPEDRNTACVLSRKVTLPAGHPQLHLAVSHHPDGDWDLIVRVNMQELRRETIGAVTAHSGWRDLTIDLSEYAGQEVLIELYNQPTGWMCEAGYWQRIELDPEPTPGGAAINGT